MFLLVLGIAVACGGTAPGDADGSPPAAATPSPSATIPTPAPAATSFPTASPFPAQASTTGVAPVVEATPTGAPETPRQPGIKVGTATFEVEPAITGAQRTQGLSGSPPLTPGSGMLFIFERESKYTFWMIDMLFSLDMVWIGAGCTVVDITFNAPPPEPGQTPDQLPRFSPGAPARYVLEINAGEADSAGIEPGDPVRFTGDLAGRHGC
ncbi:MAG: DUF192 domain-containing protein [Dehalococcoidia bacterium]|nr:DUF192 domain-containing protein [Dehalococcoidia bacterium]MDP6228784.1 DUF192 domain-containing protein [Dehalococcoidia bacterium]MDP7084656.1 DUF192 domain-containing protein [Dehalococcoidia bacterium]MDP7200860.1 DUF192 domain-containing protein [Dehalococcoidia bacterium]MDP7510767.1 DUF192 domain-containing protein [Dehalococcoidia bacterium]